MIVKTSFAMVTLILVLAGAAACGGLAILGWGGFRPLVSHGALTVLFVVLLAMTVGALFVGGYLSSGVREDRDNRWVIAILLWSDCSMTILPR